MVAGAVVVGVVSVVEGVVSVVVGVVSVEDGGGAVSVAVDVLSVDPPPTSTIPNAPEARIPTPNSAANAKTIPTRRNPFRPFISPVPLLPQIRRMS